MEKLATASVILALSVFHTPGDLSVRMLVHLAQKVSHMRVFEAQADDPPFAHLKSSRKLQAPLAWINRLCAHRARPLRCAAARRAAPAPSPPRASPKVI